MINKEKESIFPLLKTNILFNSNININIILIPLLGNVITPKINKIQEKVHYILLFECTLSDLTLVTKINNVIKDLDEYLLSTINHISCHKHNIFSQCSQYIYKNINYKDKLTSFFSANNHINNYTILPYYRGCNKEVLSLFNYNLQNNS